MTIGEKIRQARLKSGLTLEELGKACGIGRATMYKYETGAVTNIPMNRLTAIADKLGVSAGWLAGWQADKDAQPKLYKVLPIDVTMENILIAWDHDLNDEGKQKLLAYLSDLLGNPKYTKNA